MSQSLQVWASGVTPAHLGRKTFCLKDYWLVRDISKNSEELEQQSDDKPCQGPLALSSRPLHSTRAAQGGPHRVGSCWVFRFPQGCLEGLGAQVQTRKMACCQLSKTKQNIATILCCRWEKAPTACTPDCQRTPEEALASRKLRATMAPTWKQRWEVIWSRASDWCLTLHFKRVLAQLFVFNILGSYFVLEI